jgi:hypothetical protein
VLSNDIIAKLADLQKQKNNLQNQIILINQRISDIDAEYQNILNPKYFGENSKKVKFNKLKKVVPMLEEIIHERDILLA